METTTWSGSDLHSHPGVPLKDHLLAVAERSREAVDALHLAQGWIDSDLLTRLAGVIGAGHDLGKATRFFQVYLNSAAGEKARLRADPRAHHAELSAFIVADWCRRLLAGRPLAGLPSDLIVALAFEAVRRHHGKLQKLYDDMARLTPNQEKLLREQWRSVPAQQFTELLSVVGYPGTIDDIDLLISRPDGVLRAPEKAVRRQMLDTAGASQELDAFLLMELLFSLLIDADRKDAAGVPRPLARPVPRVDAIESYRLRLAQQGQAELVGDIRNRVYELVMSQAARVQRPSLMTITAPTGSGKTLAALGMALRLRDRLAVERGGRTPRIVYALPFLSIIDQTHRVFQNVFDAPGSDLLLSHHHLSDLSYRTSADEFAPDVAEMLVEGWDSEIVVTTFVQLFHTLIGHRSRPLRRFGRLSGAVVVLDEVQCLPHRYWLVLRRVAQVMSQRLGMVFVLMTATQPAVFDATNSTELVADGADLFRALDRLDFELDTEAAIDIDTFAEIVTLDMARYPERDVLVVLNTIESARSFHDLLRQRAPEAGEYYFLSSHVVPRDRLRRIDLIKSSARRKVVVSTQVVEAGVDLDCDLVYRDFGPLDALVQVAGRCNRHGAKPWRGRTRVVRLRDVNAGSSREYSGYVYDPFLLDCTRRAFGVAHRFLREIEFLDVVRRYYQLVAEGLSDDKSRDLLRAMGQLDFDGGEQSVSTFDLIEGGGHADVFVEVDQEAVEVWARYRELRQVRDLRERRTGFAQIRGKFSSYIIGVRRHTIEKNPPPVEGELGYVPLDQLDKYYDRATGFRPVRSAVEIW
ncbi:MAG: CRISPR-associated helicase Cas3' [Chloroflexi bacterium]|nr:CRISPR-associated helicase Cas3' [Chloroflexota bacterium]